MLTGMVRSTATRRRTAATAPTPAVSAPPAPDPVNKLTDLERRRVLEVLTSDRFVDLAPLQIYAQLLDEGVYLCSVSTMYRVLAENTLVAERRRLARHPAKVCPELVATAPRQVYSWDITKLAGPVKGTYFDAYVMIDIYSRYIVGVARPCPRIRCSGQGTDGADLHRARCTAGRARRSGNVDDQQDRRRAARRSGGHPVAFAATGVQRQPVLRVAVQDVEVRAGIPRTLRITLRGKAIHGHLHQLVQPRASSHRHRATHTRRRALRVGHRQSRRPAHAY